MSLVRWLIIQITSLSLSLREGKKTNNNYYKPKTEGAAVWEVHLCKWEAKFEKNYNMNLKNSEIARDDTRSSMACWFLIHQEMFDCSFVALAWWNSKRNSEIKVKLWKQWNSDGSMAKRGRQNRWSNLFWWNTRYVLSLCFQNSRWRCAAKLTVECLNSNEMKKLFCDLVALTRLSCTSVFKYMYWFYGNKAFIRRCSVWSYIFYE